MAVRNKTDFIANEIYSNKRQSPLRVALPRRKQQSLKETAVRRIQIWQLETKQISLPTKYIKQTAESSASGSAATVIYTKQCNY